MFCTHVGREVLLASKMVIFCKLGQEPKEGSFPDWHPINSCGVDSTMVSSFLAQRTRGNSLSARTLLSLFHDQPHNHVLQAPGYPGIFLNYCILHSALDTTATSSTLWCFRTLRNVGIRMIYWRTNLWFWFQLGSLFGMDIKFTYKLFPNQTLQRLCFKLFATSFE